MVAPRLPLICARATLTMEVSISSIMAADTVVMTMMALANPCTGPAILIYFYFYRYTQPGFQDILIVGPVGQFNFHGYALGHFYKVAGGIIRGKKGKLSASGQTESRYFSANDDIRVPVQFHFYVLTFFHFFQLCFFKIRYHPKLIVIHNGKQGLSRLDILSCFQVKFTNTSIRGRVEMAIR